MGHTASTLLTVTGYFLLVALGAWAGSRRAARSSTFGWMSPLQTALLLIIILALVLTGLLVEAAQDIHASFHLVFHLLGDQKLDALLIVVAQHRHEVIGLIVLASKT